MKLKILGTKTFKVELEDDYIHKDSYNLKLSDKSGNSILIDSIEHIEEIELLLTQAKQLWEERLL